MGPFRNCSYWQIMPVLAGYVKVALIPPLPFGDRLVFFRRILPLLVGTTLVPKWPRHTLFFTKRTARDPCGFPIQSDLSMETTSIDL
jgi:hypothetical protein